MVRKIFFVAVLVLFAATIILNPNFERVAAGVAILLFGMMMLENGFKVFTQGRLRKLLKNATNKLYKSISVGAIVTAFIQSSSLVTVITISFISAGLISLSGGIGLVFGANLGSTATAWLVSGFGLKINIATLAMPMLIFGLLFTFQKKETLKGIGQILAGLGFFFLGIHYMKEGFDVFKEYIDLTEYAVSGYLGVVVYVFLGIIITTILQSSSATIALILTALAAGQVEYENALALAIGANIGTTITAILGAIGSNIAGKRLAASHLVFNVVTGIVAMALIYPLANLVDLLANKIGFDSNNYTLRLSLFHTIFNVLGVIIMIPFIPRLERFLIRHLKEKGGKDIDEPKFLAQKMLEYPEALLASLMNESKYLFENAIFEIVTHAVNVHREDIISDLKIKKIVKKSKDDLKTDVDALYYSKVKHIYGEIIRYATKGQSELSLTETQTGQILEIKVANRKMVEIIRDVQELSKNVGFYLNSENKYMSKEYDKFRKKVVRVLRAIYLFRTKEDGEGYYKTLLKLKEHAKIGKYQSNESIDDLIRNNKITVDMGSSLVNDNGNVNDIIKKLIDIAELLYTKKDSLLENGKEKPED